MGSRKQEDEDCESDEVETFDESDSALFPPFLDTSENSENIRKS